MSPKYADLFAIFHEALDDYGHDCRLFKELMEAANNKQQRERFRINVQKTKVKVLSLYNDILTRLQTLEN